MTTNLSASEIENIQGNRVRSRLKEILNLRWFNHTLKMNFHYLLVKIIVVKPDYSL